MAGLGVQAAQQIRRRHERLAVRERDEVLTLHLQAHVRNVDAPLPRFRETMIDDGYVDMYEVLRVLQESPTEVALLPDHVPGGEPEAAYTIGYLRALRDRVEADSGRPAR